MRKQLARVSLETGNRIAWLTIAVVSAFCAGWIAQALSKPLYCMFAV